MGNRLANASANIFFKEARMTKERAEEFKRYLQANQMYWRKMKFCDLEKAYFHFLEYRESSGHV